jgi:hypothetical protein
LPVPSPEPGNNDESGTSADEQPIFPEHVVVKPKTTRRATKKPKEREPAKVKTTRAPRIAKKSEKAKKPKIIPKP